MTLKRALDHSAPFLFGATMRTMGFSMAMALRRPTVLDPLESQLRAERFAMGQEARQFAYDLFEPSRSGDQDVYAQLVTVARRSLGFTKAVAKGLAAKLDSDSSIARYARERDAAARTSEAREQLRASLAELRTRWINRVPVNEGLM